MLGEESQKKMFCYYSVNNIATMSIEAVMALLALLIVGKAIVVYCRLRGTHSRNTIMVYSMILLWWLAFQASSVYDITVYELHKHYPTDYDQNKLVSLSRILFLLNWFDAFIVQFILLYVPYQWSHTVLYLFQQLGQASQFQDAQLPKRKYRGLQNYIYGILKYYIKIRLVFIIFPILFIINTDNQIFFKISLACLLLDCLVIAAVLLLGMISLKITPHIKQILDQDETRRMFNQYLLIMVANTCRFVFIALTALDTILSDNNYSDSCPESQDSRPIWHATLNALSGILTHLLPIFILLRIYTVEEQPEEIGRSLILTSGSDGAVDPTSQLSNQ